MGGWGEYALAWAAFLLTHALPVRPPLRPWLVARLGRWGFGLGYSALSLAVLGWMFAAAARAPHVPLWPPLAGSVWLVLGAVTLACLILAAEMGRPNPLSLGDGQGALDPARPGLLRLTRHPLLAALALWAGAHLVANGDLAHALMFGGFLGLALAAMRAIDTRRRRQMGPARWAGMAEAARGVPLGLPGWPRLAMAGAGVTLLLALHPWVAGPDVLALVLP